jgi:hypothetical protein
MHSNCILADNYVERKQLGDLERYVDTTKRYFVFMSIRLWRLSNVSQ